MSIYDHVCIKAYGPGLNKLCLVHIFFFLSFSLFKATPAAYGGSQTRGQIGAVVASLHQGLSNTGSEPRLRPAPQITATPDP